MNIEQLAVSALRPYPKNARTHTRATINRRSEDDPSAGK